MSMDEDLLNDIIRRLLEVKSGGGKSSGKKAQITEAEIRQLCQVSKEIFLSQPNLLELEAPIKICGTLLADTFFIYIMILLAYQFINIW